LKEKLDFGTNYEGRPILGCRQLVKESFSKIYPAILGELGDWNIANRRQAASLLLRLLVSSMFPDCYWHPAWTLKKRTSTSFAWRHCLLADLVPCCMAATLRLAVVHT